MVGCRPKLFAHLEMLRLHWLGRRTLWNDLAKWGLQHQVNRRLWPWPVRDWLRWAVRRHLHHPWWCYELRKRAVVQ